jgi:predicted cupin superfamily sugar epimerase
MRPTAKDLAAGLGLGPHPEGGYYLETYRATETLMTPRGERPVSTAILFLVTGEAPSRLHRLASDELWVYQAGLPLELVTISADGAAESRVLGGLEGSVHGDQADVDVGEKPGGAPEGTPDRLPQALVPAGSWQGARLAGGPQLPAEYSWALVSCVVSPGFDFADFEMGERDALLAAFPEQRDLILAFT